LEEGQGHITQGKKYTIFSKLRGRKGGGRRGENTMERGKGKGSRIMAYLRCTTMKGYLPSFGRPRPYHTGEKIYYI